MEKYILSVFLSLHCPSAPFKSTSVNVTLQNILFTMS